MDQPTPSSAPSDGSRVTIRNLVNCSRCGEDHAELVATRMARAMTPPEAGGLSWTHWAPCPVTGDPIMVIAGGLTEARVCHGPDGPTPPDGVTIADACVCCDAPAGSPCVVWPQFGRLYDWCLARMAGSPVSVDAAPRACSSCGETLLFSARQRGDGLCGPCSRGEQRPLVFRVDPGDRVQISAVPDAAHVAATLGNLVDDRAAKIETALASWRTMRGTPFIDEHGSSAPWSRAYTAAERALDDVAGVTADDKLRAIGKRSTWAANAGQPDPLGERRRALDGAAAIAHAEARERWGDGDGSLPSRPGHLARCENARCAGCA